MAAFERSIFLIAINKESYDIQLFHESRNTGRSRFVHIDDCFANSKIEGVIMEFGVYKGLTINYLAKTNTDSTIYGFDSFEGLPEKWEISHNSKFNKHHKGYFALEQLPEFEPNVKIFRGWFDQTISIWKTHYRNSKIKFLHIDSDLYSSAITVLFELNENIVPGSIIRFDDFYPWSKKKYDRWPEGEFKALYDWMQKFNREAKIIARTDHWGCSIIITQ